MLDTNDQFVGSNKNQHQVHKVTTSIVKYAKNSLSLAGLKNLMRKHVKLAAPHDDCHVS